LEDSSWPEHLKTYAVEAWRRHILGEIRNDEIYCSYATWAGLYDRMCSHTEEEKALRVQIAMAVF
jgi:hypothetical protein